VWVFGISHECQELLIDDHTHTVVSFSLCSLGEPSRRCCLLRTKWRRENMLPSSALTGRASVAKRSPSRMKLMFFAGLLCIYFSYFSSIAVLECCVNVKVVKGCRHPAFSCVCLCYHKMVVNLLTVIYVIKLWFGPNIICFSSFKYIGGLSASFTQHTFSFIYLFNMFVILLQWSFLSVSGHKKYYCVGMQC